MTNPMELFTPFLPTTYNIPEEDDRKNVFLVDRFSNFADVINDKKIGIYAQAAENFNGDKIFYDTTRKTRNGYQTLARIRSYPNTGVLIIDLSTNPVFPIKGIDTNFRITDLWGTANKPPTIPGSGEYFTFLSRGDPRIFFTMTDNTITITTTIDMTAYDGCIYIEYIRDGT